MFEWWHWVVLGLGLSLFELAIPSFFILWFGIGAVVVGLLLLLAPGLTLAWQLLVWAGISGALAVLWFRYLLPKTRTTVGTSADGVAGEIGVLVSELQAHNRGKVRFQKPILGDDVWECYAEQAIAAGERVRVVAVEGNFIKVEASK
ncbi:MAG: NfeD family protein [Candidatus Accumulibacter sp.]|jgi:membrane protein implicated in regulation of membrane protease activity|nr:NfeD family protein [Accumulibacter sp.]